MKLRRISLINLAVYLTILGYWYNLPVISTTIFGGYNEFRLYDISFALLIIKLLTSSGSRDAIITIKTQAPLKYLYWFALWASLMVIPTFIFAVVKAKLVYIGMTLIFIYHLWGFLILAAFVATYYGGERLGKLLRWFLLLSTAHLFLYYAQISGIISHLWNERYIESYGEMAFSGTLGPNRITPGMMTLFGFVVSIFILVSKLNIKYLRVLSIVNIVLTLPAIIMIGSRTTFVTLVVFLVIYMIFFNRKLIPVVFIIIPVLLSIYGFILNQKQKERIINITEYNQVKLSRGAELDDMTIIEGYSNIGNGRWQIISKYVPYLMDNPQIIPFGSGFNNRIFTMTIGAPSAHNIYLSLINEVGLVGLALYMSWIFSYFSFIRKYVTKGFRHAGIGVAIALVIAMIVSLLAGEHLYVYRPCFAIMGTFLFVMAAINNIIDEDYLFGTEIE